MRALLTCLVAGMLVVLPNGCKSEQDDELAAAMAHTEPEVFEALLRHFYGEHRYEGYFVLIRGNDPSDEFLTRFADLDPRFDKGSRFPPAPRGKARRWEIEDTVWIDELTVDVTVTIHMTGTSIYRLSNKGGKWSVVKIIPKTMTPSGPQVAPHGTPNGRSQNLVLVPPWADTVHRAFRAPYPI